MKTKEVIVEEGDNRLTFNIRHSDLQKCPMAMNLRSKTPTTLRNVEIETFARFVEWLEHHSTTGEDYSLSTTTYAHDTVLPLMKMFQFAKRFSIEDFEMAVYMRSNAMLKLPYPGHDPDPNENFNGIFGLHSQSVESPCLIGAKEISQKEPVVDLLLDYPKVLVVDITKRPFQFSEDTAKHLLGAMYDIMMSGSDEEAVKKEEDIDKAVVKKEEH